MLRQVISYGHWYNRDGIWRILRREGLNRRPKPPPDRPAKGQGTLHDDDLGLVHIDTEHRPKLRTSDGERRKRYPFVAVERRSRSVHLAVRDDETGAIAIAFPREAARAFPFRLTHVPPDNGSCFTPAFARTCVELDARYRHTRPRKPRTDGMIERFDGRVSSEVLGIDVSLHRQLRQPPRGFNTAYKARRQRVPDDRTPGQIVTIRLEAEPAPGRAASNSQTISCDTTKARLIAEEVLQPQSGDTG